MKRDFREWEGPTEYHIQTSKFSDGYIEESVVPFYHVYESWYAEDNQKYGRMTQRHGYSQMRHSECGFNLRGIAIT